MEGFGFHRTVGWMEGNESRFSHHGGIPDERATGECLLSPFGSENSPAVAKVAPGERPKAHVAQAAGYQTVSGVVPRDAQGFSTPSFGRRLPCAFVCPVVGVFRVGVESGFGLIACCLTVREIPPQARYTTRAPALILRSDTRP